MHKKLLLVMLVPILAFSMVITSCGGDDEDGVTHYVRHVGTGLGVFGSGTETLGVVEVMFNRAVHTFHGQYLFEGLHVEDWYYVDDAYGNPVRYLDTIVASELYRVGDNSPYHWWVELPLVGGVHGGVVGPLHMIVLHETVDLIPAPAEGWYAFRVNVSDIPGYNVSSTFGARNAMVSGNLLYNWEAFMNGSRLSGEFVGRYAPDPEAPTEIEVTLGTPEPRSFENSDVVVIPVTFNDDVTFGGLTVVLTGGIPAIAPATATWVRATDTTGYINITGIAGNNEHRVVGIQINDPRPPADREYSFDFQNITIEAADAPVITVNPFSFQLTGAAITVPVGASVVTLDYSSLNVPFLGAIPPTWFDPVLPGAPGLIVVNRVAAIPGATTFNINVTTTGATTGLAGSTVHQIEFPAGQLRDATGEPITTSVRSGHFVLTITP